MGQVNLGKIRGEDGLNVFIKFNSCPQDERAEDNWRKGLDYIGFATTRSAEKPVAGYEWVKICNSAACDEELLIRDADGKITRITGGSIQFYREASQWNTYLSLPEDKRGVIATTEDIKEKFDSCVKKDGEQIIDGYKKFNSVGIDTINGKTKGNAIMRQSPSSGNVILGSFAQKLLLIGNQQRPVYTNVDGGLDDASRFKELAFKQDIPTFTLSGTTLTIKI